MFIESANDQSNKLSEQLTKNYQIISKLFDILSQFFQ